MLPILLMFLLSLVSAISTCPIEIDLGRPHILLIHCLSRYIATVLTLNVDYVSSAILLRSWSCIVHGQGMSNLEKVYWLVESGL